jgi:hypothetical protein
MQLDPSGLEDVVLRRSFSPFKFSTPSGNPDRKTFSPDDPLLKGGQLIVDPKTGWIDSQGRNRSGLLLRFVGQGASYIAFEQYVRLTVGVDVITGPDEKVTRTHYDWNGEVEKRKDEMVHTGVWYIDAVPNARFYHDDRPGKNSSGIGGFDPKAVPKTSWMYDSPLAQHAYAEDEGYKIALQYSGCFVRVTFTLEFDTFMFNTRDKKYVAHVRWEAAATRWLTRSLNKSYGGVTDTQYTVSPIDRAMPNPDQLKVRPD